MRGPQELLPTPVPRREVGDAWAGVVDVQSGVSRAPCGPLLALVNKVLLISVTPTHLRCDSSGAAAAVTDVRSADAHALAPWRSAGSLPTCSAGDPGPRGRTVGHGLGESHGASTGIVGCLSSPWGLSTDQGRVQDTVGLQGPLGGSGGGQVGGGGPAPFGHGTRRSLGGSC